MVVDTLDNIPHQIQATNHDINLEFKRNWKNKNAHIHTTNQRMVSINCFSFDNMLSIFK